jgi:hypothetical protein
MDLAAEDPRISNLLEQLDAELTLVGIVDQTFVDQDVNLDGRWFDNCTFTRCRVISRLGVWKMSGCRLVDHRGLILNGPSARLYELIRQNLDAGGSLQVAITGYRGTSGPIT